MQSKCVVRNFPNYEKWRIICCHTETNEDNTINNRIPWKEQFRIIILRAVATVVKNVVIIVNVKIY